MTTSIIKKVEQFAKKYCKDELIKSGHDDKKLWDDHVQLVRKYALQLAEIENVNKLVIEIAALLHDTGKYNGREDHAERSYKLSKEFLKNLKIDDERIKTILKCIKFHGSRHSTEEHEIEVKVIQCADALGTIFDDEWQEYSRKTIDKETLLGLFDKTYNKINLDSAKKIAKPKIDELKQIVLSM